MLKYNHIYNSTILSVAHNIAAIDSDSTNIAIYINDKLQEIVSPNVGPGTSFTIYKASLTDKEILDLIYSGSQQSYSIDIDKLIFGKGNTVYVKNTLGKYLYTDASGNTSWSSTNKSRFFFNPYYFDSDYLWKRLFKKRPNNVITSGLWDLENEMKLFNRLTVVVDTTSLPSLVKPKVFSYFDQTDLTDTIEINNYIFFKAKQGDKIKLKTDKEVLEFIYSPITTTARMIIPNINGTSINRPIIHIPVKTINPNSTLLYSKILNKGLNNFDLIVTIQGVTFSHNLSITRT